jgi:hypothetical protein
MVKKISHDDERFSCRCWGSQVTVQRYCFVIWNSRGYQTPNHALFETFRELYCRPTAPHRGIYYTHVAGCGDDESVAKR